MPYKTCSTARGHCKVSLTHPRHPSQSHAIQNVLNSQRPLQGEFNCTRTRNKRHGTRHTMAHLCISVTNNGISMSFSQCQQLPPLPHRHHYKHGQTNEQTNKQTNKQSQLSYFRQENNKGTENGWLTRSR